MAKPIVQQIKPFDSTVGTTINIVWNGNRAYSNTVKIYDSRTLNLVYSNTLTTYYLEHKIPANALANGNRYLCEVSITDGYGTVSAYSDREAFYTIKTPTFKFSNITEGMTVANASYQADLLYDAGAQSEQLNSYTFYLYDSTKKLLLTSKVKYLKDGLSYNYRGLENDTDYYFRATGVTENGFELDTGLVKIYARYTNPNAYSRLLAENRPNLGCINCSSNICIIQNNEGRTFEFLNLNYIDLRDSQIFYDSGFTIDEDFTITIQGCYLWHEGKLLNIVDKNNITNILIDSHIYPQDNMLRYRVKYSYGSNTYILYSKPLSFKNEDIISIQCRKIGNFFDFEITKLDKYYEDGNSWFAIDIDDRAGNNDNWLNVNDNVFIPREDVEIILRPDLPPSINLNTIWFGTEV